MRNKIALVNHLAAIFLSLIMVFAFVVPSVSAKDRVVKQADLSKQISVQIESTLRSMLLANAHVNIVHPSTLHAAISFEMAPATNTQFLLDRYNLKYKVQAHLVSLSISKTALWNSNHAAIVHAHMIFQEYLGLTHVHLQRISWNYYYVMEKDSNHWKVADVLPVVFPNKIATQSKFDFAPDVNARSVTGKFMLGLVNYQKKKLYPQDKVTVDGFGYYYESKAKQIHLYLFIHNGTKNPVLDVNGKLLARSASSKLFSTNISLTDEKLGILFPGQTRFCIIHVPGSAINNLALALKYPVNASFTSSFSFVTL